MNDKREIKFRAWHISKKEMLPNDRLKNLREAIKLHENEKVVLQQFTGLKDKNGLEIYEGDIYKIEGYYYQVIFDEGAFTGGKELGSSAPLGWRSYSVDEVVESDFYKKIEVVGNIYENKDLLT